MKRRTPCQMDGNIGNPRPKEKTIQEIRHILQIDPTENITGLLKWLLVPSMTFHCILSRIPFCPSTNCKVSKLRIRASSQIDYTFLVISVHTQADT